MKGDDDMKTIIRKGSKIDTLSGYLVVNDYNGSIFYADEYIADSDGNPKMVEKLMLTASDIQRAMKQLDGRSHIVRWE